VLDEIFVFCFLFSVFGLVLSWFGFLSFHFPI
jgi:hypothetical protein